jgi:CRISPR type III-A-associated protein Csm2
MSELESQDTPLQETQAAEPTPAAEAPQAEAPAPAPAPEPAPEPTPVETAPASETAAPATKAPESKPASKPQERGPRPPRQGNEKKGDRPAGERGPRPERGERPGGQRPNERPAGDRPAGERGERRGPRDQGRPGGDRGGRPPEPPTDIDIEKLVNDSLYLDNQAHAVVARMRDMDSGTRSQLRRFYSAVRRACRAAETDRQHQFVMLRARLAYTIARHQLRSLDPLERLLLQVTRKNDARGYERFRDLFEAIVAYNE